MIKDHIRRLTDGLSNAYNLFNLGPWIEKHTYLDGRNFTFKDHEYQLDIISDPANTVLVNKCAQVGLSEIFSRWALAIAGTQENFTLIWTFPSASDAERFAKARLDPTIAGSKELRNRVSKSINSTELKQFGYNTFVYIRGTLSDTAGLSVPADVLIHDELDRSDLANVSAYVSRLQHKPTKVRRLFSTPTVRGYGIDAECKTAKRKRQIWKCSHCNHYFLPDYEQHVHIPGWDKPKKEINRYNLTGINWRSAVLLCPGCGKAPSDDVQYRSWVVENNDENYDSVAYYVAPFCAPRIITSPYLVKSSTDYNSWSEFVNQALGQTSEDAKEALTIEDLESASIQGVFDSTDLHVMGVDMGLICHFIIAKEKDNNFIVVHREKVPYTEFETRRRELCARFRVVCSVHDAFPYTDLITRVTKFDPNAYGAVYVTKMSTETHSIKEQEENPQEGKLNIRSVHINRDVALDTLMWAFKEKRVVIGNGDDEFKQHMLDMKRVQKFDKHGGIVYRWEKTIGVDHWHHTMLYAFIAAKLRGMTSWVSPLSVPLVSSIRMPGTLIPHYEPKR